MWAELIGSWLPTIITGILGGGGVTAGVPIIRRIMGWLDNKNAKQGTEAHGSALDLIRKVLPDVIDYVKARAKGDDDDALSAGVELAKGLVGQYVEALNLSDDTLRKWIKAGMYASDKLREKAGAVG